MNGHWLALSWLVLQCLVSSTLAGAPLGEARAYGVVETKATQQEIDQELSAPKYDPLSLRKPTSCAVVSGSGSLIGSKHGKAIDEHDTVFRTHMAPIANYSDDVGTRADVEVLDATALFGSSGTKTRTDASLPRLDEFNALAREYYTLMLLHEAHDKGLVERSRAWLADIREAGGSVQLLSRRFERLAAELVTQEQRVLGFGSKLCARSELDPELCAPSATFIAALAAIVMCDEHVDLYGFIGPHSHAPFFYYAPGDELREAITSRLRPAALRLSVKSDWQAGFQERRVEFLILARLAQGRPPPMLVAWRRAARATTSNFDPPFPKVSLVPVPKSSLVPDQKAAQVTVGGRVPGVQPPPKPPVGDAFDDDKLNDNDNDNDEAAASVAGNAVLDDDKAYGGASASSSSFLASQHALEPLRRQYDVVQRRLSWESERPPSEVVRAFHRFERELQRNLSIGYSEVKRLERAIGALDSQLSVESVSSDETGLDYPPVRHHNKVRMPVVPAAYAERGASVKPLREEDIEISNNYYMKSTKLGAGTYGAAYLCEPDPHNTYAPGVYERYIKDKPLVIKVLKAGHREDLFGAEVQILLALRNVPYALQLLDVVRIGQTHHGLVFPYTNTTYYKLVYQKLSAHDVRNYLYKTLVALDGAHSRGIVHMDIKPINIFFDHRNGDLQLGDWGLGYFFNPKKSYSWRTMTMYWKAPEVFMGARHYSYAVDIWSVGACFAGMMVGKYHFFDGRNSWQVADSWIDHLGTDEFEAFVNRYQWQLDPRFVKRYLTRRRPATPWLWYMRDENRHMFTAEALDLVNRMLRFDPAERITAREALRHPYFESVQATHLSIDQIQSDLVPLLNNLNAEAKREDGQYLGPDAYAAWQQRRKKPKAKSKDSDEKTIPVPPPPPKDGGLRTWRPLTPAPPKPRFGGQKN